eukprot:TCONS_00065198-protein
MDKKLFTSLRAFWKNYLFNSMFTVFIVFLLSPQYEATSSLQQAKYASCLNDNFYLRKFDKVGITIHYHKTEIVNDPVTDWKKCFQRCRLLNCVIFTVWKITLDNTFTCRYFFTLRNRFHPCARISTQPNFQMTFVRTECNPSTDPKTQFVPVVYDEASTCNDILQTGQTKSGIYQVGIFDKLYDSESYQYVLCEMNEEEFGAGWTVIQRNYEAEDRENFWGSYQRYKHGFGHLQSSFWIGLETMYQMTKHKDQELLIVLQVGSTIKRAVFDTFYVGNETEGYKLNIGGYSQTDSTMADSNTTDTVFAEFHNGFPFTVPEVGGTNCATASKAGWWFNPNPSDCFRVFLNGQPDLNMCSQATNAHKSLIWNWASTTCFEQSTMMIRKRKY